MLILGVTNAISGRVFSRLKTKIRTTIHKNRQIDFTVLHVYQKDIDKTNIDKIAS